MHQKKEKFHGISLFFDAFSDPIVGVWSDRFKSKLGRRHPFIYASIFPLAFCIWLLFIPPSSYDQTYLFLKLLILTVCIRLAITFFETPWSFKKGNCKSYAYCQN